MMRSLRLLFGSFLLILAAFGFAQGDQVAVPPATKHIVDLTGTLTADETAQLDNKLRSFEASKGSQIVVLMVPSTQPETIEQYALRIAEQWKVGRKNVDDGAVLVIAKNDRTLRVEVGYGLEGALNDATAKQIIDDIIVPHFKRGNFAAGVNAGVDQILSVVEGEPLPPARQSATQGTADYRQLLPMVLAAAFVLGGVMCAIFGRVLGAVFTGGIIGVVTWFIAGLLISAAVAGIIGLIFTLLAGGRNGMAGPFIGGGGFGGRGGGFGGGGFGGGGGGFGGGGASGRW